MVDFRPHQSDGIAAPVAPFVMTVDHHQLAGGQIAAMAKFDETPYGVLLNNLTFFVG